jgi:hypothetical protein
MAEAIHTATPFLMQEVFASARTMAGVALAERPRWTLALDHIDDPDENMSVQYDTERLRTLGSDDMMVWRQLAMLRFDGDYILLQQRFEAPLD